MRAAVLLMKPCFSHARCNYTQARIDEIEYMDVATNQITSLAAALILYEHDDATVPNGSNMQRQAVPYCD